jgi:hypothetical protein
MNTRALDGLIAINVGLEFKLLTPALFTMLVIMALATTAMCGPLLRWWLPKELRKARAGLKPTPSVSQAASAPLAGRCRIKHQKLDSWLAGA